MRNPSISLDGKTLYFSSDMPGGHGGEDIWSVTVNGDTYGKPQNLGSQVNTEGHESFPSIIDNNLYFASNGKQGLGGYDIFVYNIENKENSVNLDSPINSLKDDFSFTLNKELKQGYFASNRDGNDDIFQATPICYFNPKLTVKDKETGVLLEDAIVNLYNSEGNLIAKEKTNTKGEVSFEVLCKDKYKAITERNGYENGNIEVLNKPESNNATEVLLEPIKPIITDTEIILQPIFFEYNESFITALGAQELDKLVSILEIKETIKIHIKAHTDSRGNDKYNLVLSEKRAKSTQEYIISKGIARDRITSEGKGETELKVNCSNCSEEEHAQNRRSEFLIK